MGKKNLKRWVSCLLSAVLFGVVLSGCSGDPGPVETGHTSDMESVDDKVVSLELKFGQSELYSVEGTENEETQTVSYDDWTSTDYVEVNNYYALSYVLAARGDLYAISFFDEDKQFVGGTAVGEGREEFTIATVQGSVVIPEGAVYARFIHYEGDRDPMKDAAVTGYGSEADYAGYLSSLPFAGLKIACLGDSLTEGDYGLKVGVANVFYRNYPFYLAQLTGATTVNYGYCGITSSIFLNEYRAGNVDVTDADVVILMLGTNLGLEGELGEDYGRLVDEIQRDMKQGAELILVAPPHATEDPSKPNYGYNGNVKSAVEFVRGFAVERGLSLIDAYADSPIQPENEDKYQSHDGLHMNEAGYEAFAEFVADELKGILGTGR